MESNQPSLFREAVGRLTSNRLSLFSCIYISIILVVAIITPFIAPYDYAFQDLDLGPAPPSSELLFGTDSL